MSQSSDEGVTWSLPTHTNLPNPGSAAEVKRLRNGFWVLVYNDTEVGRRSLAVSISDNEGKSWRWTRHLEQDLRIYGAGQFHYPSVVQARDGMIHVSYSYFLNHLPKDTPNKTIKHVVFNLQWVQAGDSHVAVRQ
jgi:predicted neuraminidase